MSAAAQLKFTQNAVSNTAGQAMTGVTALPVIVGNWLDNGTIVNWQFIVLDVSMPGSALTAGSKQNGNSPTWTFTPDADTGMVFIQLITTASDGTVASDTLCFGVPSASTGLMHPAFGVTARHVNFAGQTRGWASGDLPSTTAKMLGAYLKALDSSTGATAQQLIAAAGTLSFTGAMTLVGINTTAGAFNVNIPAAAAGQGLTVQDYLGTFNANPPTLTPPSGVSIENPLTGAIVTNPSSLTLSGFTGVPRTSYTWDYYVPNNLWKFRS
jgi:hypothetical protein